jgi:hypothetical protein
LALVCNIDQRGRAVRYRIGFVFSFLGVAIAIAARALQLGGAAWFVAGPLLLAGAFSLFEANRGWCGLRALGIKTKI